MNNNNKPLVSVIICNYNYGDYISEAIESVLSQTYQKLELIIVDDGSTDNSREIISNYDDPRIVKVFQENQGQGGAFNSGFANTNGEIIAFLDSDDWWKPEKIETIVKWDKFLEGKYSIIQHFMTVWKDGEEYLLKNVLPVGNIYDEMKKTDQIDFFMPTSALCFRRKTLESIFPIPSDIRICADAYLMRTSMIHGDVISIPFSLGYYRQHANTVFGNENFDKRKLFIEIIFPAINSYYSKKGLNYKLSEKNFSNNSKMISFFNRLIRCYIRLKKTIRMNRI